MFTYFTNLQKQLSSGVLIKSDHEKIRKIHKKTSVVESFFSPVQLQAYKPVTL